MPGHTLTSRANGGEHERCQVDAESHLELVRELEIRSTPTTLFINSQGIEVGRAAGTPKRDQVLAALANIA